MLPRVVITSASTARSNGMPATAKPVAVGGCAWTTARASGRLRYTSRCILSSDEGSRSPATRLPSRSVITIMSGVMNPLDTLLGVVIRRFSPKRTLMLPSLDATNPRTQSRRPTSTMSARACSSMFIVRLANATPSCEPPLAHDRSTALCHLQPLAICVICVICVICGPRSSALELRTVGVTAEVEDPSFLREADGFARHDIRSADRALRHLHCVCRARTGSGSCLRPGGGAAHDALHESPERSGDHPEEQEEEQEPKHDSP